MQLLKQIYQLLMLLLVVMACAQQRDAMPRTYIAYPSDQHPNIRPK